MMKIDAVLTAGECTPDIVQGRTAIVIDVLRATSVIVTALSHGAREVLPFASIEEAFAAQTSHRDRLLLGGERGGVKIEGFDLGNSPLEYSADVVRGRSVALTTTNGTQAIERAKAAQAVYILSFLNLSAVVDRLAGEQRDIVFVCSGTKGRYSMEDGLCAGACIDKLVRSIGAVALSDAAELLRDAYTIHASHLPERLRDTKHARWLAAHVDPCDLDTCFRIDVYDCVPSVDEQRIVI